MGLQIPQFKKFMFWNCRGYPWDKGLGLSDVAQGINVIFLVETWRRDSKHIPKIDGYLECPHLYLIPCGSSLVGIVVMVDKSHSPMWHGI